MGICAGSCGPLQHQQLELEPELEVSRVGAEVAACRWPRRAAGMPASPACLRYEQVAEPIGYQQLELEPELEAGGGPNERKYRCVHPPPTAGGVVFSAT
jgi:hypothetical protein